MLSVCGPHWWLCSLWFTFGFLRGNCPKDKFIRDNTWGVWLPIVEPWQEAGLTHLKLLSQEERVSKDGGGSRGNFWFTYFILTFKLTWLVCSYLIKLKFWFEMQRLTRSFFRFVFPECETEVSYLPFSLVCQGLVSLWTSCNLWTSLSHDRLQGQVMSRS